MQTQDTPETGRKPAISLSLKRKLLNAIEGTDDVKTIAELSDKLLILLAQSKRKDTGKPRTAKGAKPAETTPPASGDNLLGITQ